MATRAATVLKPKPKANKIPAIAKAPKKLTSPKTVASPSSETDPNEAREVPTPKSRRKPKAEVRTRIYWGVFNQSLKRVAVFEFDQKGEAEKRAVKLHKSSGEQHFIQKLKAIVQ